MTSRKKVSFGSSGSIVETWIIDDVRSNQFSPSTDVNKFGSIEFCDDVMPTSRDIVVVSQPMNCNHNNHVVLNDPISIFRKDMDMDMTSKQTDEKETASNNKEEVITSQPKDVAILNITSKTVNFSSPPEIISGNIKTDNKDNTSKSEKHKVRISPYKEILNNNNSSDSNKNNNNNNSSAVISTTQQYHTNKRSSISSVNSSGSQSFRPPKIIVNTPGTGTSNQEEYYDVLNPQPVGQT